MSDELLAAAAEFRKAREAEARLNAEKCEAEAKLRRLERAYSEANGASQAALRKLQIVAAGEEVGRIEESTFRTWLMA